MREHTVVANGREMVGWRQSPAHPAHAPPVVCVHGAGVSSRELHPLVAELGRDVDAWTVDLPGFGRSAKPDRALTLPQLADSLAAWLDAAHVGRACLVGCSFGCQIAVDVALRHPSQVAALVLVGPTIDPRARSWPRLIGRWLRNSVHEDPRMLPLNIADYADAGTRRVVATFRESIRDHIEVKLPYVTVPALVVRGELDRLGPHEWAEEVTRLLPDGRLATVPRVPHMIPYRAPRELSAHITAFLAEVPHVVG